MNYPRNTTGVPANSKSSHNIRMLWLSTSSVLSAFYCSSADKSAASSESFLSTRSTTAVWSKTGVDLTFLVLPPRASSLHTRHTLSQQCCVDA